MAGLMSSASLGPSKKITEASSTNNFLIIAFVV
jgi:hypothetical protein